MTYLLESADKWGLPQEYLMAVKFGEDTPKESFNCFVDDDSSNGGVSPSSQYFLAKSSIQEKMLLGLKQAADCWTYSVTGANRDKKYYIGKLPLKKSPVKLAGKYTEELDVSIFKSAQRIRLENKTPSSQEPRTGSDEMVVPCTDFRHVLRKHSQRIRLERKSRAQSVRDSVANFDHMFENRRSSYRQREISLFNGMPVMGRQKTARKASVRKQRRKRHKKQHKKHGVKRVRHPKTEKMSIAQRRFAHLREQLRRTEGPRRTGMS